MSCSHEIRYGGPRYSMVTCGSCGQEWQRYSSSADCDYEDCPKCEGKKMVARILAEKKLAGKLLSAGTKK